MFKCFIVMVVVLASIMASSVALATDYRYTLTDPTVSDYDWSRPEVWQTNSGLISFNENYLSIDCPAVWRIDGLYCYQEARLGDSYLVPHEFYDWGVALGRFPKYGPSPDNANLVGNSSGNESNDGYVASGGPPEPIGDWARPKIDAPWAPKLKNI